MASIETPICKEIRNILDSYLYEPQIEKQIPRKLLDNQNKTVRAPFKDDNGKPVFLSLSGYIHLMNMSMQQDYFKHLNEMYYIQEIFKMVDFKDCHGKVAIKYFKEQQEGKESSKDKTKIKGSDISKASKKTVDKTKIRFIQKDLTFQNYDLDIDNDTVKQKFLEKFFNVYNKCIFISLAVSFITDKGAHANVLFIYKDTLKNKVYLTLYEPHGIYFNGDDRDDENQMDTIKTDFLKFIKTAIESQHKYTCEILRFQKRECPIGIQIAMQDKLGYCAIISALIAYILLSLMKNKNKEPESNLEIFMNLDQIENCIIRYNKKLPNGEISTTGIYTQKELQTIVENFGYELLTKYLNTCMNPTESDIKETLGLFKEDEQEVVTSNYNKFLEQFKKDYDTETEAVKKLITRTGEVEVPIITQEVESSTGPITRSKAKEVESSTGPITRSKAKEIKQEASKRGSPPKQPERKVKQRAKFL